MTSLSLAGVYCVHALLGRCVCKCVDVYIITLLCTWRIYALSECLHQSLSGMSPPYLANNCRFVADARERRLCSTASRTCVVTRTYSTFGDRAFSAAGRGLWNSLPSHLKDANLSYSEFRRLLKTFLFGHWTVGPLDWGAV